MRLHGAQSVELLAIDGAGDPKKVVEQAIDEARKTKRDSLGDRDMVWAMFDRDEHHRFRQAKIMARDNGIGLAVSDPCFELWGIFHYQDYDAPLERHECQRRLAELCPGYGRQKHKIFDDPVIRDAYPDARGRAEKSLARREEEGDPEGNPSTTVHRLTEHLLGIVARFRGEAAQG